MSDSPSLASKLSEKLAYENVFFHEGLCFDVRSPPSHYLGNADIVVCSEVLEHVAPPIVGAFNGLFSLLRPGGSLIFSVPWTRNESIEHFPELFDWHIEQEDEERVLINTTADGRKQLFRNLRFHGGVGSTLEMRMFGLLDLLYRFAEAGFCGIRVMQEDVLENGIRFASPAGIRSEISRPITCRRPWASVRATELAGSAIGAGWQK